MDTTFHDDLLDKLAGKWRIVREFSNRKAESDAVVEWVLNHQFLHLHMKDVERPPRYEAQIYIGFNPEEQRYVAHWIDVFGGQFSETLGFGKREGDSIVFEFHYPDGFLINLFSYNTAMDSWTSKIDQQNESGEMVPFCLDTYKR